MQGKQLAQGISPFYAVLGVGVVALIIVFIALSSARKLSSLEVALFTVLIVILQTAVADHLGRWRARGQDFQPFVRSALRRVYSIRESLDMIHGSVQEGARRIGSTPGGQSVHPQTIEEIMRGIASRLMELRSQTEASIKDWGEVAWEEYRSLQEGEDRKREEIADLESSIAEVRELIKGIPQTAPADTTVDRLENVADALARQLDEERGRSVVLAPPSETVGRGEPRRLLVIGAVEEAINAYSRRIELEPGQYTLYIGRARARYLAGERDGALADLHIAEGLNPNDPTVQRARVQISTGQRLTVATPVPTPENLARASEANACLVEGKTGEARRLYEEARQKGLSPTFFAVDVAMVDLAEGDAAKSLDTVRSIDRNLAGVYMRVNLEALEALCATTAGTEPDLTALRDALAQCGEFSLTRSPLRFLRAALLRRGSLDAGSNAVFECLGGTLRSATSESTVSSKDGLEST